MLLHQNCNSLDFTQKELLVISVEEQKWISRVAIYPTVNWCLQLNWSQQLRSFGHGDFNHPTGLQYKETIYNGILSVSIHQIHIQDFGLPDAIVEDTFSRCLALWLNSEPCSWKQNFLVHNHATVCLCVFTLYSSIWHSSCSTNRYP